MLNCLSWFRCLQVIWCLVAQEWFTVHMIPRCAKKNEMSFDLIVGDVLAGISLIYETVRQLSTTTDILNSLGLPHLYSDSIFRHVTSLEDKVAKIKRGSLGFINGSCSGTSIPRLTTPLGPVRDKVAKIRRGLPGFVNGSRTSALADTGAAQNVVSAAFAEQNGLVLEGQAAVIRLGNSKEVRSDGKFEQAVTIFAVLRHFHSLGTFDHRDGESSLGFCRETNGAT